MNEEELQLLRDIYKTRRHLFAGAFFFLILAGIVYGQRIDRGNYRYGQDKSDITLTRSEMKIAGILWLEIPVCTFGAFVFFKRIRPFQKDIADGRKYRIYHAVTFKQYFPLTNQYFISLNDADYMHHEVDKVVYEQVNEGDAFPVYFTRYAHYAFNKNGSFTIM